MAVTTPTRPIPATEPPAPSGRWGGLRRAARIVLGTLAWALLLLLTALATAVLFMGALAIVKLGSAPQQKGLVILLMLTGLAWAMYWLVVRYVTPASVAWRVVGLTVVVLLFAGAVWAPSSPDRSLFLAREAAWGDSDVHDYQKFPERTVANAAPVFNFATKLSPELFQKIEYTAGGQTKTTSLDELLRSTHTTSFLVIKDDAIRYEGYFNGYRRDSIVTSFSVAKSVTSALVGIAIDEGYIHSVDDPIVTYLPEMRGRGLDTITIRDLLLMSTGIQFVPQADKSALAQIWPFHDEALSYYYPNMRDLAVGLPKSAEPPGAAFNYNQYHPLLLGMILERTTHRPVTQYLQEKIWKPLGMEYPASWSLDSTKHGFEKMESGINGRAIDFAKFGRLFLDNGSWNGRQLISSQWVADSTAPDPSDHRPWLVDQDWKAAGGYYKYMWWGMPLQGGGYWYSALGHLGQLISVFPQDHTVVVRFGIDEGGVDWSKVMPAVAAKVRG